MACILTRIGGAPVRLCDDPSREGLCCAHLRRVVRRVRVQTAWRRTADVSTSCFPTLSRKRPCEPRPLSSLGSSTIKTDVSCDSPAPPTRNSSVSSLQADDEDGYLLMDELPPRQRGRGLCPCGRGAVSARGAGAHPRGPAASREAAAAATSTACRSCLARRRWLDSVSARLLVVACRKVRLLGVFSFFLFPYDVRVLAHTTLMLDTEYE